MPRVEDNAPAAGEPEHGFAALEAKVEEVQLEAANEADTAVEDAAAAAQSVMLEQAADTRDAVASAASGAAEILQQSSRSATTAPPAGPLKIMLGAFAACMESSVRLQTDTLASLSRVRSPADLLAAQLDYGRRTLELCTSNMARLTQALPAVVRQ